MARPAATPFDHIAQSWPRRARASSRVRYRPRVACLSVARVDHVERRLHASRPGPGDVGGHGVHGGAQLAQPRRLGLGRRLRVEAAGVLVQTASSRCARPAPGTDPGSGRLVVGVAQRRLLGVEAAVDADDQGEQRRMWVAGVDWSAGRAGNAGRQSRTGAPAPTTVVAAAELWAISSCTTNERPTRAGRRFERGRESRPAAPGAGSRLRGFGVHLLLDEVARIPLAAVR